MVSGRGDSRRRWLPHLLLFVVVLIWSGNTVVSKLAFAEVAPPQLALVRFSLAVLAFHLPLFLALHRRGVRLARPEIWRLILIGAGGAGTSVLSYTIGLNYTPATYTSLISMTGPPITALMAFVLFHEVLGWTRALGTAIALMGAAMLVTGGQLADPRPEMLVGTAYLIASQAFWAIYILYGKPLLAHRPPLLVLSASHLFALISLWPLSVPAGGWAFVWEIGHWSLGAWVGICYLAFVNTALSQVMFTYALREVSSAQAVSYTYLQPAMTAVMAMLVLGEQPTLLTFGCGLVILAGIYLVNRPRAARRRAPIVDTLAGAPRPVQR
jgi:drug/metabolite transporter (DMT)-like permease